MNHPAPKARWLSRTGIRRNSIYWLPNAITTCALFAGFYAIVQAMNLQFELAAQGVFAAMVFDGLDGRVARLTRTQSEFGAEYDSLSDMVSFGAAPALVIYDVAEGHGQAGLVCRIRLLRLRGIAPGALQHQYRRGRQALLPGLAEPGRSRTDRGWYGPWNLTMWPAPTFPCWPGR